MRRSLLTSLILSASLTSPATAQSDPATTPTLATPVPTLRLTAPVGTTVEQRLTITERAQVSNVTVTARPGATVAQKDLDATRRLWQTGSPDTVTTGKVFTRLQARDEQGRVTLVQNMIRQIPELGMILNLRITYTLNADGSLQDLKISSDNPEVTRAFEEMDLPGLLRTARSSGAGTPLFGAPLVPGQSREAVQESSVNQLLEKMLMAILGSPDLDVDPAQKIPEVPMTVRSQVTYRGLNGQGLHRFEQTGLYDTWEIGIPDRTGKTVFQMALRGGKINSEYLVRPDGLPFSSTLQVRTQVGMFLTLDDKQIRYTQTQEQTISLRQP